MDAMRRLRSTILLILLLLPFALSLKWIIYPDYGTRSVEEIRQLEKHIQSELGSISGKPSKVHAVFSELHSRVAFWTAEADRAATAAMQAIEGVRNPCDF